jgi:hypothetical protein
MTSAIEKQIKTLQDKKKKMVINLTDDIKKRRERLARDRQKMEKQEKLLESILGEDEALEKEPVRIAHG